MARKRPRRLSRSKRPTLSLKSPGLGIESLEGRWLLSASPSAVDDPVGSVVWNGQETIAYRDSYLVQMPTTKVAGPAGRSNYVSAAPAVNAGWMVQGVGFGFYSVFAPGSSVQTVQAWADSVGALSIEPNQVLVKQELIVGPPEVQLPVLDPGLTGDEFYASYLWGLNNTGTFGISRESRAAAQLGNEDDIYPRIRDSDIDAPEAWFLQTGTREVIVAVFDDGIDDTHPDLGSNMWRRPATVPATWTNPATGNVEPFVGVHGFNSAEWLNPANGVDNAPTIPGLTPGINAFYEGSSVAPYNDLEFRATRPGDPALIAKRTVPGTGQEYISWRGANDAHGTHVAGIIGAGGNNGTGVTGVNWAVSLYSANIFRYGDYNTNGFWVSAAQGGSVAAFLDAANRVIELKTVYDQNIVVANLSFNTYNGVASAPMAGAIAALDEAGILCVTAAGNGYDPEYRDGVGDRINTEPYPLNDCPIYPAAYKDGTSMIVVTASDAEDKLPRFANWGPDVDIAAPGENIMSTVPVSARAVNPGTSLLRPGLGPTDIPIQYDSHEPIGLFAGQPDPPPPSPPGSWGGSTGAITTPSRGYIAQPNISRPYNYRELVTNFYPSEGRPYAVMSGTSMSTAYVSGIAALMSAEFYRWTGSVPTPSYLRQGILGQADSESTLTYEEGSNFPPHDYQFRPIGGAPIARTGMYERTTDPESRTHSIPGNRRANAYNSVFWTRNNLPPSVAIVPQIETDANLGESRLEGDDLANPTIFDYALAYVPGTGVFSGVAPGGTITLEAWTQDIGIGPNYARAGFDYLPVDRGLTFDINLGGLTFPFSLANNFRVEVIGDSLPENNESFNLNFRIINSDLNVNNVWCKTRIVGDTIIDDDPSNAKPLVSVATTSQSVSITENNGGIRRPFQRFVEFSLDRPAFRDVLVPYRTAQLRTPANPNSVAIEGQDYLGASLTAKIPAGRSSVKVPVYIIGDTLYDLNNPNFPAAPEQFRIVLGAPNLGVTKRGGVRSEITIIDNETAPGIPVTTTTPVVSIAGPVQSVLEGGVAQFTVQLREDGAAYTVPAGSAVTVFYTVVGGNGVPGVTPARPGSDFRGPASGKITIPAGASSFPLNVATLADRLIESDETFTVRISRAVLVTGTRSRALQVGGGTAASASATIQDAPSVAIASPGNLVSKGELATFLIGTVNARGQVFPVPDGSSVTVEYVVVSGSARVGVDVVDAGTGSIVIPAGNSTGTIDVFVIPNGIEEGEKTFSVRITRAILTRGTSTQLLTTLGSPLATGTIAAG